MTNLINLQEMAALMNGAIYSLEEIGARDIFCCVYSICNFKFSGNTTEI